MQLLWCLVLMGCSSRAQDEMPLKAAKPIADDPELREDEGVKTPCDAEVGEFGWLVGFKTIAAPTGLYVGERCGGALLQACWVLTAAHCLDARVPPSRYEVFAGDVNLGKLEPENGIDSDYQVRRVDKIFRHPQYIRNERNLGFATRTEKFLDHNVALMHVEEPFDIAADSHVTTLTLSRSIRVTGRRRRCLILGWGEWTAINGDNSTFTDQMRLKFLWTEAVPYMACSGTQNVTSATHICVQGLAGSDPGTWSPCSGDSGTPLVCQKAGSGPEDLSRYVLLGISSWNDEGIMCDTVPKYLHVSELRDWIENTIAKHSMRSSNSHRHRHQRMRAPRYDRRPRMGSLAAGFVPRTLLLLLAQVAPRHVTC